MHDFFELAVAWTHVLAAALWVGGLIVVNWMVRPATKILPDADRRKLIKAISDHYDPIAGISLLALIAAGLLRAWHRNVLKPQILLFSTYGNLLLLKMSLATVISILLCVSLLTRRHRDSLWSSITILSILILVIAVYLRVG